MWPNPQETVDLCEKYVLETSSKLFLILKQYSVKRIWSNFDSFANTYLI